MARKPRNITIADGSFFHTMWRCHNKDWLFQWDWSKELYYELLLKYKDKYNLTFHSYHFMDNHIHLTGKIGSLREFSDFFRLINNLFARNFSKRASRCGQAVMQRFLSPEIKDDSHMLAVMAYIDLNAVRAGKHKRPEESEWSSYKYYAYGMDNLLVKPVDSYVILGNSDYARQEAYRNMVLAQLPANQP